MHKAHRLAFLYVHGFIPTLIDHINRNKSDNRIENLRECTAAQKSANRAAKGYTSTRGKHKAQIMHRGKNYNLGLFDTPEEAAVSYNDKRLELFGKFA